MKKTIRFILLSIAILSCGGEKNLVNESETKIDAEEISQYLQGEINTHQIPGLGVAVIKNGKVLYEDYFGLASIENQDSVDAHTVFRIYSATKLMTATGVFQLVENQKIALQDTISQYISGLPEAWRNVKIEHLLTHSSGIPDIIRFDNSLSDEELINQMAKEGMDFEPGSRFWYNQTNYWFLARIIEQVEGTSFEEMILGNQFSDAGGQVFFSSNSLDYIPHRANKYEYNFDAGKLEKVNNNDGERAHPGNGINITLPAFIEWNQRLDNQLLLNEKTKDLMWKPFNYQNGVDNFRHGWGDYSANGIESVGFTGGGVSGFRKFPSKGLTIIYLSNGYKYFPVHNRIINHIAGLVDSTLINHESLNEERVISNFLQNPIKQAVENYYSIKKENPDSDFEGMLNSLGYAVMKEGRTKDAIEIFEINASEHPNSGNAYDSLAEGYFKDGQFDKSIQSYKKSLELDNENNNARVMIDIIRKQLEGK